MSQRKFRSQHWSLSLFASLRLGLIAIVYNRCIAQTVPKMSFYSNETAPACISDTDCGVNRFCARPPLTVAAGSCLQCWRCTLFSEIYGSCPEGCYAVIGSSCTFPTDCGQGLFCGSDISGSGIPTCKSCFDCKTDSDELYGACSDSCPSGPLALSGYNSSLKNFVFLAFQAAEISASAESYLNGGLRTSDLDLWLESQTLALNQTNTAEMAFFSTWNRTLQASSNNMSVLNQSFIPTTVFVSTLMDQTSLAVICPVIPSDGMPAAIAVFPGCPCNATSHAATFQCTAGYRCSSAAYHGLDTEVIMQPALARLKAVCVPCNSGQYCTQGTYIADEADLSPLDCATGMYCPTPGVQLTCPAGYYCIEGTVTPITCNYNYLLNKEPYSKLPMEPTTVLQRVRDDGDPLAGNICPAGSTVPNTQCSGGYYCPNITTSIICPAGHFCKAQSITPLKCGVLSSCPVGTTVPKYSGVAFLTLGIVVGALPLLWLLINYVDRSVTATKDAMAKTDMKRSRVIKMQKSLMQSFRTKSTIELGSGGKEESSVMSSKFPGFGMVEPRIKLEFENLGMRLANKDKIVLHGVSGFFPSGKLNAVMGPSGSGKTTFLNVLCGKVGGDCIITGAVRVNEHHMPLAKLKKIMGFVPQDDTVHTDLTVRENLVYAACLRLPREVNNHRRRALVIEDALEMLQLKAIQNFRVGSVEKRGISGGQRKRVNIGLELVAQPSILFLDEPTSGLDSTVSSDILGSLADMTSLGMTVIAVIHQPRYSSFNLFDQVLLLGHGGQTVYMGPPGIAVVYFRLALNFTIPKNENPADMLMDIIGGKLARDGDPRFKPSALAEWWSGKGPSWVFEFEKCNPLMKAEDLQLDPETLQDIDEAFDEVDREATGRINAKQLLEMFESLGMPITEEDAVLLIRKIKGEAGSRPGSVGSERMPSTVFPARPQPLQRPQSAESRIATISSFSSVTRTPGVGAGGTKSRPGGSSVSRPASARPASHSQLHILSAPPPGKVSDSGLLPLGILHGDSPATRAMMLPGTATATPAVRELQSRPTLGQRLGSLLSIKRLGSLKLRGPAGSRAGSTQLTQVTESDPEMQADVAAADPSCELTVTKEQLMEALEKTYDKKVADASADPMLRFADPQMQYNLPKVKVVEDMDTLLEDDQEGDDSYNGGANNSLNGVRKREALAESQLWAGEEEEGTIRVGTGVYVCSPSMKQALSLAQVGMPSLPRPAYPSTIPASATLENIADHIRSIATHSISNHSQLKQQILGPKEFTSVKSEGNNVSNSSISSTLKFEAQRPCSPLSPPSAYQPTSTHRHLLLPETPKMPLVRGATLIRQHPSDNIMRPFSPAGRYFGTSHQNPLALETADALDVLTDSATDNDNDSSGHSLASPQSPLRPKVFVGGYTETRPGHRQGQAPGPLAESNESHFHGPPPQMEEGTINKHTEQVQKVNPSGPSLVSEFGGREDALSGGGALVPNCRSEGGALGSHRSTISMTGSPNPRVLPHRSPLGRAAFSNGGSSSQSFPSRLAGGVAKTLRTAGANNSGTNLKGRSRNGGKPHTRETVWVEGLLAGVLHQSISARRVAEITSAKQSSNGEYVRQMSSPPGSAPLSQSGAAWRSGASVLGSGGGSTTGGARAGWRSNTSGGGGGSAAGGGGSAGGGVEHLLLDLRGKSRARLSKSSLKLLNSTVRNSNLLDQQIMRRRFPLLYRQLWLLLQRGTIKYIRAFWPLRVVDSLLLLIAAFIIGFIHTTSWGLTAVPSNVVMAMTCLGVLSTVAHMRTFSQDRVLLARETSSGISIGAFFLSQNVIDMAWVLVAPAIFLGGYYYLTLPRLPFSQYYVIAMCVCWWASGLAYLVSAALPPQTVLMAGVFIALIFGAFLQGLSPTVASSRGSFMEYLLALSYNRWAMEIMTISESYYYQDNMRNDIIMLFKGIGLCNIDQELVISGGNTLTPDEAISFLNVEQNFTFASCTIYQDYGFVALIILGSVFRILAFLLLRFIRTSQY